MNFKVMKTRIIAAITPLLGKSISNNEKQLLAALKLADTPNELWDVLKAYKAQSKNIQNTNVYNKAYGILVEMWPGRWDTAVDTLTSPTDLAQLVVDGTNGLINPLVVPYTAAETVFGDTFAAHDLDQAVNVAGNNLSTAAEIANSVFEPNLSGSIATGLGIAPMEKSQTPSNSNVNTFDTVKQAVKGVISDYNGKMLDGPEQILDREVDAATDRAGIAKALNKYAEATKSSTYTDGTNRVGLINKAATLIGFTIAIPGTPTYELADLKSKLKIVISDYNGKMIDGPEQILAREVDAAHDKTTIRDAFVKFGQATKDLSYDDGTDRIGLIGKAAALLGTSIPVPVSGSDTHNFNEFTATEINRFYYAITNGQREAIPDGEMVNNFINKGNSDGWSRDEMVTTIRDYALSTNAITQDEYNRQVGGNAMPNNFFAFNAEEVNRFYLVITNGKLDRIPDANMLQDIVNKGNSNGWSRDEMITAVRDYALSSGAITQDEYNTQIGVSTSPATSAGVGGSSAGVGSTTSTSSSNSSSTPSRQFRLIRGSGAPAGANQLRDNGNAVFLVSSSGELFHVTEQLAKDMVSDGTWYEPEVLPQSQVNGMTLRASLNHTSELGVLTIPPSGEYLLVRGTGAHLSESQLAGNGDAVYAIDRNGNKYHVTAAVAQQMQQAGTWMEPAILDQGTVDSMDLRGALASAGGGVTNLSISVGDPAVVTVVGIDAKAPGTTFRLVRGNGASLGNSQLKGNGAAVYALYDNGKKLHVTEAMAAQLKEHGLWAEPTVLDQTLLDSDPVDGAMTDVNGGSGPLVIKFEASGGSAAPSLAAPTISNSFKLVRGTGPNMGTKQLTGNGAAVYAVFDGGKKLHVTAAMAEQLVKDGKWEEPTVIDQNELDSTPVAGTLADTNGRVGSLEVPLVETPVPASNGTMRTEIKDPMPVAVSGGGTSSSSSAPAPTTSTPTTTPKPAWTPDDVVDKTGEKRDLMDPKYGYDSVQERIEVKNHIYQSKGTFQELDQIAAIYDSKDPQRIDDWERFSHTGKYAPGATPDVAPVAAVAVAAPAPSTPVNNFKLVRGNGPGLGNSHLLGNGAAVYAIFDNGTKLHVTGAMAGELQNQHRWVEPEVWDQNTLDQTPPQGRMVDVNGGVGSLEVQWLPPAPATPSPDPVIPPAAPAPTPQPETPVDFAWDRNGVARNLFDPSLHYDTPEEREKVRASVTHGGSWEEVDQVGAIYDSQDPVAIDNWERFSSTGKYSVDTPWGAEYRKAITEGIDHNTAVYWCNSKYGIF